MIELFHVIQIIWIITQPAVSVVILSYAYNHSIGVDRVWSRLEEIMFNYLIK